MAERKEIGSISVITDSETPYDNIGDIEGGFSEPELENQIRNHGHHELLTTLAYMTWQVWDTVRKVNAESASTDQAKTSIPESPIPLQ